MSDQEADPHTGWLGAELTPSKVRSDVHPILGDGSEQGFTVSSEILGPIGVIDSLVNWHILLIHYREPVLCHAADPISVLTEGFQDTRAY